MCSKTKIRAVRLRLCPWQVWRPDQHVEAVVEMDPASAIETAAADPLAVVGTRKYLAAEASIFPTGKCAGVADIVATAGDADVSLVEG